MGMPIDKAIKGVEKRILPIYDNDADHKALETAIAVMRKYQQLQADYEARLKADTTEKFKEFRDKLSKWMFHNSESVCGCSMIDIDYLEGQMDELLYELGIYEVIEDGNDD